MKLKRKTHSQQSENIIPLINIVFLLLIFFMITAKITANDNLDIHPPLSQFTPDDEQAMAHMLLIDRDGRWHFQNQVITIEQITSVLPSNLFAKSGETLFIKADAQIAAHQLIDLLKKLRQLGISNVKLLTLINS